MSTVVTSSPYLASFSLVMQHFTKVSVNTAAELGLCNRSDDDDDDVLPLAPGFILHLRIQIDADYNSTK